MRLSTAAGSRTGIAAETRHPADLSGIQSEEVLDERRLAGPVLANQAKDASPRNFQRHLQQRRLVPKVAVTDDATARLRHSSRRLLNVCTPLANQCQQCFLVDLHLPGFRQ